MKKQEKKTKMHFHPDIIAEELGLAAAILFGSITYYMILNQFNQRNYYDDRYWTYDSVRAMHERITYLSESTIRRALTTLEKNDYIITGNYNKMRYDRTKWYTLSDKGLDLMDDFIKRTLERFAESASSNNGDYGLGEEW